MTTPTLDAIAHGLSRTSAIATPDARIRWRAAVAIVLRDLGPGPEVLVIRRAIRPDDRWSGQAALPGGKADPGDTSIVATAVRETREEVGVDLSRARVLGRLSDHPGGSWRGWARWSVTPVLFAIADDPPLVLDTHEVASAQWVPLAVLAERPRHGVLFHWWRPVWRLPIWLPMVASCWRHRDLTIWGLTRSILKDVLAVGRVRR